jgi:hypothetical protein
MMIKMTRLPQQRARSPTNTSDDSPCVVIDPDVIQTSGCSFAIPEGRSDQKKKSAIQDKIAKESRYTITFPLRIARHHDGSAVRKADLRIPAHLMQPAVG